MEVTLDGNDSGTVCKLSIFLKNTPAHYLDQLNPYLHLYHSYPHCFLH